ncbi:hypothetical protein HYC85_012085 [Camellia sinensis]|uniref:Uncharacterized protein n=1 Tax=Camellia sinensis TaxID=4442 RepID=A0A7J7HAX7_CAMSI|nr:hypothetical protein HYC85_012085 [Camellia sinensis]
MAMNGPGSCSPAVLKAGLVVMALCLAGYIVGPPLYWHFMEGLAAVSRSSSASSCPPCLCDCPSQPVLTIPQGSIITMAREIGVDVVHKIKVNLCASKNMLRYNFIFTTKCIEGHGGDTAGTNVSKSRHAMGHGRRVNEREKEYKPGQRLLRLRSRANRPPSRLTNASFAEKEDANCFGLVLLKEN